MTTLQEVRERYSHIADPDERERLMCEALMEPEPQTARRGPTANARRRRNYAQMGDEKLRSAIRSLELGFGDAYDQCIERGHDPADDLWLAKSIARRKGWLT